MSSKQATATDTPPKPADLLEALLGAQAEFPEIPKDRENTYFHSRYSTLDAIISSCRPVLNRWGFIVDHYLERRATVGHVNPVEPLWFMVARLTFAATNETRENAYPLAADFETLSPQARGSEITYGRRYSLAPLLGITSDEDDDGNAASGRSPENPRGEAKQPAGKAASSSGNRGKGKATSKAQAAPASAATSHADPVGKRGAEGLPGWNTVAEALKIGEDQARAKAKAPSAKTPRQRLVDAQKRCDEAETLDQFAYLVGILKGSHVVTDEPALADSIHLAYGRELETRLQKGQYDRANPDVDLVEDALKAIGLEIDRNMAFGGDEPAAEAAPPATDSTPEGAPASTSPTPEGEAAASTGVDSSSTGEPTPTSQSTAPGPGLFNQ